MCVLACVCRCLRRPEEGVGCPRAEVAEIVSSPAWGPRAELRSSGRAQCSASGLSLQPCWQLFASLPAFVRKQISSALASLRAGVCVFTTTWHVVPASFAFLYLSYPYMQASRWALLFVNSVWQRLSLLIACHLFIFNKIADYPAWNLLPWYLDFCGFWVKTYVWVLFLLTNTEEESLHT